MSFKLSVYMRLIVRLFGVNPIIVVIIMVKIMNIGWSDLGL